MWAPQPCSCGTTTVTVVGGSVTVVTEVVATVMSPFIPKLSVVRVDPSQPCRVLGAKSNGIDDPEVTIMPDARSGANAVGSNEQDGSPSVVFVAVSSPLHAVLVWHSVCNQVNIFGNEKFDARVYIRLL